MHLPGVVTMGLAVCIVFLRNLVIFGGAVCIKGVTLR